MSKEPVWLRSLHSVDQATAKRWLREGGGEAALLRIAKAALETRRPRGRPSKKLGGDPLHEKLVQQAATLWMTSSRSFSEAAAQTAQEVVERPKTEEERCLNITFQALRRSIRETLEDGDEGFWITMEERATGAGLIVDRSPNDKTSLIEPQWRKIKRFHAAMAARYDTGILPEKTREGLRTLDNICSF